MVDVFASTATDVAVLITAGTAAVGVLTGSAVSLIGAWANATNARTASGERAALAAKVDVVREGVQAVATELRTLNGSSVGQLADADETRRVEAIPDEDRTAGEREHIAVVPPTAT